MPDYAFNYNLGPQNKPMTIADMLGIAQAAQQFQQTQQMNPLQVQQTQQALRQQQLNTQKMEALTPEEIQTGTVKLQEERKQAPIATKEKEFGYQKGQAALGMQLLGGLANDPRIQDAAKNPKGAIDVLIQGGKLLQAAGLDENTAGQLFAPLIAVAQHEPDKLPLVMRNLVTAGTSPESQAARGTPQLTSAGGAPALFTPGEGKITQPQIQNQPQSAGEPAFPEPLQPTAQPKQGGLPYPVRKAGDIRPYAPGEKQDEDAGLVYKNGLVKRQGELTTAKRNLDEVIKEATKLDPNSIWSSGFLGMVNRKFKEFTGDPTYKQLSKDLANVQIANIQAMGGSLDTVAGQQLTKMANGDETFPPSVLINIARRAHADLVDLDMRATAAEKFARSKGLANMNKFKQDWAANSDSKLFEAIAIDKSKMSAENKKKAFIDLFGFDASPQNRKNLSEDQLQELNNIVKKKSNIMKMVNGDFEGIQ